jgi:FkbM family methyltransferase
MDDRGTIAGGEFVQVRGVAIPLDPDLMSPKIQEQLRAGRYEGHEAERLPGLIQAGERVMELGAGVGFLTALAGLQRLAACIVAVEANPVLIPLIERVHRLNGVESIVRHGVVTPARGAAALPFHVHVDLWASSLDPPAKARLVKAVVEVPVLALADLLAEHSPTLLIIDVEVLHAWATDLDAMRLDGVAKVMIELKPGRFEPRQIRRIFDAFSGQGFWYDPAQSVGPLVLFRRLEGES